MTSAPDTPLARLLEPLDDLEYTVAHAPVDSTNLVEKLYIQLDLENQPPERRFIVELFFVNDVLQAFGGDDDDADTLLAQFTLLLPIVIPDDVHLELHRCLALINRLTPLGAFGLSEADQAVYLRYTLAGESREIADTVLIEVLSIFEYLCQEYLPLFETVRAKTLTAQRLTAQFAESGHAIPSMGDPRAFISQR